MKGSRLKATALGAVIIVVNIALVSAVIIGTSERGFRGWWETLNGIYDLEVSDPLADLGTPSAAPQVTARPDDGGVTSSPSIQTATPDDIEPVSQRYADGEDLVVVVLGDQTGTHENDWVGAWARALASERQVSLRAPLASDPTSYSDPVELGLDQDAARIDIYNASYIGGTADYAAARLTLLAPEEPDLVILNFGRSNTPEDLPQDLDEIWQALQDIYPRAEAHVVVQPPRMDGGEPVTDVVRDWADGVAASAIDVAQAFADEELVDVTVSTRDPLSVNIFGGQRWALIVQEAVFADLSNPFPDDPFAPGEQEPASDSEVAIQPTWEPTPDQPVQPSVPAPAPGVPTPTPQPSSPQPPAPTSPQPTTPPVQPTTPAQPTTPPAPPTTPVQPTTPPEPQPTEPDPTPDPTEPEPDPTFTDPTIPDPEPTEPEPTDPAPTTPVDPTHTSEPEPTVDPTDGSSPEPGRP